MRAIQEWNKLNVDLKCSPSTKHFKGSLYKTILKKQFITQSFTIKYLAALLFIYLFISLFFTLVILARLYIVFLINLLLYLI